ncbi:MAG: class I SAM-dependent methyltransferase [Candidatus Sericytochromatia bacterium]|nr:class I SAM-dependent methyltransferase [Candidatus Sericytochromatia bacterium]
MLQTGDPRLADLPRWDGTHALVWAAPGWAGATPEFGGTILRKLPGATQLPEPLSARYDAVALLGVLSHVANPTSWLHAARAALRPGAVLLLVEELEGPLEPAAALHREIRRLVRAEAGGGEAEWPPLRRFQLGSIIQGLGLGDYGFSPWMPPNSMEVAAANPQLTQERDALERLAQASTSGARRDEASALLRRLETERPAWGPVMRVWGIAPAQ